MSSWAIRIFDALLFLDTTKILALILWLTLTVLLALPIKNTFGVITLVDAGGATIFIFTAPAFQATAAYTLLLHRAVEISGAKLTLDTVIRLAAVASDAIQVHNTFRFGYAGSKIAD